MICGNAAVKKMILHCVQCCRLHERLVEQKMVDLPCCRVVEAPPFTFYGVGMFGPFIIKQRRSQVKHYRAMFTCMSCQAVHIESNHSIDTDSVILGWRCLIARRGNVQTIFLDNSGSFIGSESELRRALEEMDKEKLQSFMQASDGDWFTWKSNPRYASHICGVWEHQTLSALHISFSQMQTHGRSHDEESLANSRDRENLIFQPLATDNISDPTSSLPLSPYLIFQP